MTGGSCYCGQRQVRYSLLIASDMEESEIMLSADYAHNSWHSDRRAKYYAARLMLATITSVVFSYTDGDPIKKIYYLASLIT